VGGLELSRWAWLPFPRTGVLLVGAGLLDLGSLGGPFPNGLELLVGDLLALDLGEVASELGESL